MASPDVTPQVFRQAMGRFATGVTVVTTVCDGAPYGLTVSALCSVSLDPPMLLISLQRSSQTLHMIQRSGCFGVNILSVRQRALAERFARKGPERKTFDGVPYHLGAQVSDVALLDHALACVECAVAAVYPGGDHVLLLGEVKGIEAHHPLRSGAPLLAYQSTFHAPDLPELRSDTTGARTRSPRRPGA